MKKLVERTVIAIRPHAAVYVVVIGLLLPWTSDVLAQQFGAFNNEAPGSRNAPMGLVRLPPVDPLPVAPVEYQVETPPADAPPLVSPPDPVDPDVLPHDPLPVSVAEPVDASDLDFRARWNYGVWFETMDGSFRANIGGRVEQDWVWIDTSPEVEAAVGAMEDGVFFRRARIHGAGTMYGVIDLFAEFEAAPVDNIVFQDMWAQLRDVPVLGHIRAGHIKVPFGLENYTSAKYITFMERSALHDAFQQEYDPGIEFWNYGPQKNASWAVALMRFDPDESGRGFGNGQYCGVGRVTLVPWSANDDRALVHLGGAFRYNNGGFTDPALGIDVIRFRARPEFRNTQRFVDTGPLAASAASFMLFESAILLGPFSVQGEYLHSTVHDASIPLGGPDLGNVLFDGYHVYVSYMLTGETRPYDRTAGAFGRVLPQVNVRPGAGNILHQGAWEAAVRYSYVDLNDGGVFGGELKTVTAGLTWYLNPTTKLMFNYIWARRDVPGPVGDGDANLFGTRFHISF